MVVVCGCAPTLNHCDKEKYFKIGLNLNFNLGLSNI